MTLKVQYAPQIYVACLASYNNGKLHGAWINANTSPEEIHEQIKAMLALSTEPFAEEWAIHDSDGFEGIEISEYASIEKVSAIGVMLDHQDFNCWTIAEVYLHKNLEPHEVIEYMQDNYQGEFESREAWAEQFLDETEQFEGSNKDILQYYFDFDRYTRDSETYGNIFTIEEGYRSVHVFWNR